ncbi:MAG: hypothetical protein MUF07_03830 [Steroidobacteraceae bacterium]|jgi:hypothetical protein|nr:hypothetical protein [Steroidobacteraceae bacterium]
MSSSTFGILELLAFFGIAIGIGLRELWVVRRDSRRAREAEERARQPQGSAPGERGTGSG